MAFKAKIIHVEKTDDTVVIQIEFTDGVTSFFNKYPFPHNNELNTIFDEMIQADLKIMNEFDSEYSKLKAKEGQEISLIEI